MANNRLEAVLDIGLNLSKAEAKKVRQSLQGVFQSALPKNFQALDLDSIFKFDGRSKALRGLRGEIERINAELSNAKPERARFLQGQKDTLESIAQIQRTRVDASRAEIKQGEKIAKMLKERKTDYRQLNDEQKKYLRTYRDVADGRLRQTKSAVGQAQRLSGGASPFILTGLRDQQRALEGEIKTLDNLTNIQKLEAEDRRRTSEALRKEREQIRERDRILRENNQEAKASRRREKKSASRQRARSGLATLNAVGGPDAVGSVPHEDLPYVTEGVQRRLKAYNRLQDNMLRQGRQNTAEFARNKQQINEYADALQHAQQRMRGFASVVRESTLFLRQFIRLGLGFSAVFSVINGVQALGRSLVELNKQLKSIQAISQATDREMRTIGAAIKSVAQQTIYSTTEIAQATQTLAQAGVKIRDIPRALKATAQFASGTASDIETSADLLTTMNDVFDNLDFKGSSDELTRAINVSKTSADDLKTIVSTSASTAKEFQVGANHYLAAVSALRNAGLKASTVGTGLRRVMIDLFTPDNSIVKQLQKRYKELGENLTKAQIKGRFFAFSKQRDPLVSALKELQRLGYNQGEGKRQLQSAFDIRSRNALSALVSNIGELEKLGPQIQVGNAALSASQTQMESLANSAKNLGAAITVMADSIAGDAVPALAEMTRDLTTVVQKVTNLNEGLKASTGTGLGSALSGGALSGLLSYVTTRGGIGRKFANAVGGSIAGTGAGLVAPQSGLSNSANAVLSAIAGPAFVSALGAAISKGLESTGRAVSVSRGGVNNTGRPMGAKASNAAARATSEAANGAAAFSLFAGKIGVFFTKIGSFVAKLFSPLSDVFKILGNVASKVPVLGRIAGFLATKANPIIGAITTIASVASLIYTISQMRSGKDVVARLQASRDQFRKQVEKYNDQLDAIKQFDLSGDAPENSAAAALKELKSRQQDLEAAQANFLGGTVQNLDEVSGIFEQLASGRGASLGSDFRKHLLKRLASQIDVVGPDGKKIEISSQTLESNQKAVQSLADTVAGVNNQADGLQKSLVNMIEQIKDKPVSQLNDTQKALRKAVDGSKQLNYEILTGLREADPDKLSTLLTRFFNDVANSAKDKLDKPDFGEQVRQKAQAIASGKLNKSQIGDQIDSLRESARQLNISTIDFLDRLKKQLDDAREAIKKQGPIGRAARNALMPMGGLQSYVFNRPKGDNGTAGAGDSQRATDTGHKLIAAERSKALRDIQSSRESVLKDVRPTLASFADAVKSSEFQQFLREQKGNYKQGQLKAFESLAHGGDGAITQNGPHGLYQKSAKLKKALGLYQQYLETGKQQAEQDQKVYQERADLQRQVVEYDQKLAALKKGQAPLQEKLHALAGKQRAKEAQLQDELAFQLSRQKSAALDADKQARLSNKITKLKTQLEKLHFQQVNDRLKLIKEDYQNKSQRAGDNARYAASQGDTAAYNQATSAQRKALEHYLQARRPDLKRIGLDGPAIDRLNDQLRKSADLIGQSVSNAEKLFGNTGAGRWLDRHGTSGFSSGNARLDAYRQQQGYNPSDGQQTQLDQQRLSYLQRHLQFLKQQREANKDILNKDQLEAYDQKIRQVNADIGKTQGELRDLGASAGEQLRKGFDPTQLRNALQQTDSSVKNLGTSIRNNLTGGIDSFADSLTQAEVGANSFKDAVGNAFQSLAQSILKSLNRVLANRVAQQLLGFAASVIPGAMGAGSGGTSFSQAAGTVGTSYNDGLSYGGSHARGVADLKGRGTETSDSNVVRVSKGESILTAKATRMVGADFVNKLNSGVLPKYRDGGVIGKRVSKPKDQKSSEGGPKTIVNVENHTDGQTQTHRHQNSQGDDVIDIVIKHVADDIKDGGPVGQAVLSTTNAGRRLHG